MKPGPDDNRWTDLDRDLRRISRAEHATAHTARPLVAPGVALAFLVLAGLAAAVFFGAGGGNAMVIAAAVVGAYMALNIGANDVANNMGPAVGARVLTPGGALVIAALCEAAGALLAGGDVVETISREIVDPASIAETGRFVRAMLAALLAAALWVNAATWLGAPVSTTHSLVGGVMGAGLAAAGVAAVSWPTFGAIAASWVMAPLMGGVIAAAFLALIKSRILYRDDRVAAARRWVPVLVGVMAGVFAAYLALKGLARVADIGFGTALGVGLGAGLAVWALTVPAIRRRSRGMENSIEALKPLFALPLILSAALLSFAHGANDVANAVGPLAAIVHATEFGAGAARVAVPQWVMAIGALGISFGLFLFGPRLIRTVGSQITRLNPMRAWCVALSAAITVILASGLGLPVSSTHIAVGGVFGVGFFREWFMNRRHAAEGGNAPPPPPPEERRRRKLVRRSHFLTIVAAWVVTVPAAAGMSALLFFALGPVVG